MQFDLLIFGGGPAGIAAAITANRLGHKVGLIERSDFSTPRPGEHLSPAAIQLLKQLEIWDEHQDQHWPCSSIKSAWGSNELLEQPLMSNPYGYGRHLVRSEFDAANFRIASELGVRTWKNCRYKVSRVNGNWLVSAVTDRTEFELESPFIVDATGRAAGLAKFVGCRHARFDRLIGIQNELLTAVNGTQNQDEFLLIESAENGWWYCAQTSNRKSLATFMTDADMLGASGMSALDYWSDEIKKTKHVKRLVANYENRHAIKVRPASSRRLTPIVAEGFVAVGDSAQSYDPLSSQGIATSIESATRAVRELFSGTGSRLDAYQYHMDSTFDTYLAQRAAVYAAEQRWPQAEFWKRRQHLHTEVATWDTSNQKNSSNIGMS